MKLLLIKTTGEVAQKFVRISLFRPVVLHVICSSKVRFAHNPLHPRMLFCDHVTIIDQTLLVI